MDNLNEKILKAYSNVIKINEAVGKFEGTDELGKFWVVTKYHTPGATIRDILFETDIAGIYLQFRGGLKIEEIVGIYKSKAKATKTAKKLMGETDKKYNAKEIQKKMKANKMLKGFAEKLDGMKTITSRELDNMLPDYIEGKQIYQMFGEDTIYEAKGTPMVCIECGKKFNKKLKKNQFEVQCPKCKGYDVEVA